MEINELWNSLTYGQRLAITRSTLAGILSKTPDEIARENWDRMLERDQQALMRIDWEMAIGRRLP